MKPRKLIKELEKQLRKDNDNLVVRLKLAAAYRDAGRVGDAVELYISVARAYHHGGRHAQAAAVCKSVLEIEPGHAETHALQRELERARRLEEQSNSRADSLAAAGQRIPSLGGSEGAEPGRRPLTSAQRSGLVPSQPPGGGKGLASPGRRRSLDSTLEFSDGPPERFSGPLLTPTPLPAPMAPHEADEDSVVISEDSFEHYPLPLEPDPSEVLPQISLPSDIAPLDEEIAPRAANPAKRRPDVAARPQPHLHPTTNPRKSRATLDYVDGMPTRLAAVDEVRRLADASRAAASGGPQGSTVAARAGYTDYEDSDPTRLADPSHLERMAAATRQRPLASTIRAQRDGKPAAPRSSDSATVIARSKSRRDQDGSGGLGTGITVDLDLDSQELLDDSHITSIEIELGIDSALLLDDDGDPDADGDQDAEHDHGRADPDLPGSGRQSTDVEMFELDIDTTTGAHHSRGDDDMAQGAADAAADELTGRMPTEESLAESMSGAHAQARAAAAAAARIGGTRLHLGGWDERTLPRYAGRRMDDEPGDGTVALAGDDQDDTTAAVADGISDDLHGATRRGRADGLPLVIHDDMELGLAFHVPLEQTTETGSEKTPTPFSIFSSLPPDALTDLAERISLRRFVRDDYVLREGDPSSACYIILSGEVQVLRRDLLTPEQGEPVEIARLGDGALFGEYALLAARRRQASVRVIDECHAYEIPRRLLRELAASYSDVGPLLDSFYRERLLTSLLGSAPYLKSLAYERQVGLRHRFETIRVSSGDNIVVEGSRSGCLYLVVLGSIEVTKRVTTRRSSLLATLSEGAYFADMALLEGEPANVSVRAASSVELLALSPEAFHELIEAHPDLWNRIRERGRRRDLERNLLLTGETSMV